MLDITDKTTTLRIAQAQSILVVSRETIKAIKNGEVPKGDPIPVARVAAIQAAKDTSRLIPYCHPIPIDGIEVEITIEENRIVTEVSVSAIHKTGVEMEALTGASVSALTLYDMLKGIDETLEVTSVKLLEKRGGKSDFTREQVLPIKAGVLVISDSVFSRQRTDTSGKSIVERLLQRGVEVVEQAVVPDDVGKITETLCKWSDEHRLNLVLTTGGTGFGPRDVTPEAMSNVLERESPGISETARAHGQARMPYSMLSRSRSGIRGKTLIVNLPGSRKGVNESLDAILPGLLHSVKMLAGGGHNASS